MTKVPARVQQTSISKAPPVLLKSELVMTSPEMARTLRAACHFERQRPLNEDHILRLAEEMERGAFIPGTQIFLGVYPDKSMVILNGNHTLEAVALANIPLSLTFTYAPCRDEDEAGRIYAQFDIHRVRNWSDAFRAYGFNETLPPYWSNAIGTAVGVIMSRFAYSGRSMPRQKSREVRAQAMRRYADQAAQILEIVKGVPNANLQVFRRGGVMAVALETLRYQPSMASEFWHGFMADDGLRTNDPRKTLLNYLRVRTGNAQRRDREAASKACAQAWNAYFKERDLMVLRPAVMQEFFLEGTPWIKSGYDPLNDVRPPKKFEQTIQVAAVRNPSFVTGVKATQNGEDGRAVYYDANAA